MWEAQQAAPSPSAFTRQHWKANKPQAGKQAKLAGQAWQAWQERQAGSHLPPERVSLGVPRAMGLSNTQPIQRINVRKLAAACQQVKVVEPQHGAGPKAMNEDQHRALVSSAAAGAAARRSSRAHCLPVSCCTSSGGPDASVHWEWHQEWVGSHAPNCGVLLQKRGFGVGATARRSLIRIASRRAGLPNGNGVQARHHAGRGFAVALGQQGVLAMEGGKGGTEATR